MATSPSVAMKKGVSFVKQTIESVPRTIIWGNEEWSWP